MAKAKARSAEVLPAVVASQVSEDEQLVEQARVGIEDFFLRVRGFFVTATALEQRAVGNLATARALTAPETAEQDEHVQKFIKATNQDRREVEAHWGICSTVSQFHKRLVAARSRGTDPNEEASRIAQNLHNRYVEAEKRRAAQEQERIRLAAEQRAREERDADLARIEAEALAREAESLDLSERERVFVDGIVGGATTFTAARVAGYKHPDGAANRLMGTPKILAAIQSKREAMGLREQARAVAQAPVEVEVEVVRPNISRAAGASDRTTWSAEVLDENALILAVLSGRHGIPADVLTVNRPKLNEYARSLHERIDLWPGVRHVKKTTTV